MYGHNRIVHHKQIVEKKNSGQYAHPDQEASWSVVRGTLANEKGGEEHNGRGGTLRQGAEIGQQAEIDRQLEPL